MTEEQIKQNAETAYPGFEDLQTVYIEGAHSLDEEIKELNGQVTLHKDRADYYHDLYMKLRNPWISVEDKLPDQKIGLCLTLIYDLDILTMKHYKKPRVSLNVYKGNNTWDKGTKTEVRYWMPIPELKKGE